MSAGRRPWSARRAASDRPSSDRGTRIGQGTHGHLLHSMLRSALSALVIVYVFDMPYSQRYHFLKPEESVLHDGGNPANGATSGIDIRLANRTTATMKPKGPLS